MGPARPAVPLPPGATTNTTTCSTEEEPPQQPPHPPPPSRTRASQKPTFFPRSFKNCLRRHCFKISLFLKLFDKPPPPGICFSKFLLLNSVSCGKDRVKMSFCFQLLLSGKKTTFFLFFSGRAQFPRKCHTSLFANFSLKKIITTYLYMRRK